MTENETKSKQTAQNSTKPYSVMMIGVLSDEEQIDAVKRKVAEASKIDPALLVAIGTPSSTKDGLRVEFGVKQS